MFTQQRIIHQQWWVLLIVTLTFMVGCDTTKKDWETAKAENTIQAFEDFLKQHPKGQFADSAQSRIEAIYFEQAQTTNTIQAYEEFLKQYPEGKFVDEARSMLEEIYPSFLKDKVLKIKSISASVGKGEISFTTGKKPQTLRISINVRVPVVKGKMCMGCGERVRIAPDLRVPLDPWFTDSEHEGEEVIFENIVLEGPIPDDATEFIVSGPEGATLKKKGKGFLLVEGEAHFLQIKYEK